MPNLNYQALNTLITRSNWWFSPSELHGILSALSGVNRAADWSAIIALGNDTTATHSIPELQQHINQSLANNDLSYQLLLADDNNLAERAESLAMWAQGFTLAINYLREQHHLPQLDEASLDFIADLTEIAKLDSALPDTEDNRQQLTELEEHARMGALMLYAASRDKK